MNHASPVPSAPIEGRTAQDLDLGHLHYLRSRGISDTVIEARGYFSSSLGMEAGTKLVGEWSEAQKTHFAQHHPDTGELLRGLAIPLYGQGTMAPHLAGTKTGFQVYQIRPDLPRPIVAKPTAAEIKHVEDGGEPSAPKVSYVKFEFPPGSFRGDEFGQLPADVNPAARHLYEDLTVPLFITEGAAKGDAALSAALAEGVSLVPVTLTGVTVGIVGKDNKDNRTGAPIFHRQTLGAFPMKGRAVYIAWDSDWVSNQMVGGALHTMARLVAAAGGTPLVVDVPAVAGDGTGVDDYLAHELKAGRSGALTKLLAEHTIDLETLELIFKKYGNNDASRGERLAEWLTHHEWARFNFDSGIWMTWTDCEPGVWSRRGNPAVLREAQKLTLRDKGTRAEDAARSSRALKAAAEVASYQPGIGVHEDELDTDPWALNTRSGVIDLHSGELRSHSPSGVMHTMQTATTYSPDAQAPTWDAFLKTTFNGNRETIRFLQKWLGMGLVGKVLHEGLLIAVGVGNNGKSTLFGTVDKILGSYSYTVGPEMLTGDLTDEKMVQLKGRRLALAQESGAQDFLDERAMKQLTSRDVMTGRELYTTRTVWEPTHSLVLSTNHVPKIGAGAQDFGTWRRIRILKFSNIVAPEDIDATLGERLELESPGVLAWLVAGAVAFSNEGLGTSGSVMKATEAQRDAGDLVGMFLAEKCVVIEGARVTRSVMYNAFKLFCEEQGRAKWSLASLTKDLQGKGVLRGDDFVVKSRGSFTWKGVGLAHHGGAGTDASGDEPVAPEHQVPAEPSRLPVIPVGPTTAVEAPF